MSKFLAAAKKTLKYLNLERTELMKEQPPGWRLKLRDIDEEVKTIQRYLEHQKRV